MLTGSGPPIAPRAVFCVIEQQHRSRTIADAVRAGSFHIHGVTLQLGTRPDWMTADLPADREWRLEWGRFYYGLDLAAAFQETGDSGYVKAWEQLVTSWIDQVPCDFDPSDVIGRRIQNWIYAWCGFARAPVFAGLRQQAAERLVASLDAQVQHLRSHLTRDRNHRTLELYALFIAALALPQLDPDGDLLQVAVRDLAANLMQDVHEDGVQRERSTHYHHVVLRSFLGMRENARRFHVDLPAAFDERLSRACEFAMHVHRPDGTIPALSDSDTGSHLDLLQLAGRLLGRSDFEYVATRGGSGTAPAVTHASFARAGYYTQRSGWGARRRRFEEERFLIFNCGALGDGRHGHYDALSVDVSAEGRPLVVDPGRYTYCDDPPHWRRWFKSTAAHNTITVDGLDQTPYRRGRPKGPVACAVLLQRLSGEGLDVLWGEVRSPAYEVVHRRRVLFVRDEYWVIDDHVQGLEPHRYELRFHLAPASGDALGVIQRTDAAVVAGANVAVAVATPGTIHLETGWVAPTYGHKVPAPVIVVTREGAAVARFVTLVVPRTNYESYEPVPRIRCVEEDGVTVLEVAQDDRRRTRSHGVAWSTSGEERALAPIGFRAAAAWTRALEGPATRWSCARQITALAAWVANLA
jgi:hypothetical protein